MAGLEIPAFSTWKMFYEMVPMLRKGESVKHMAYIIKTKEFTNMFVYHKEHNQTFEQYQKIVSRYQSFTTWLLGQFFYLSSCDNLVQIHDVIIDVQISTLERLSKSHLHVYEELSNEYSKAFDLLIDYYKSPISELCLKVFIPVQYEDLNRKLDLIPVFINLNSKSQCFSIIGKLVKIIKYILSQNFLLYSFDDITPKTLDNLIYLLCENNFAINLEIFQILVDILEKARNFHQDFDVEITEKVRMLASLFEQIVYDVYNKNIKLSEDEFKRFEATFFKYLGISMGFNSVLTVNAKRLHEFVFWRSLDSTGESRKASEEIREICAKNVKATHPDLRKLAKSILDDYNYTSFQSFFKIIHEEIKNFQSNSNDFLNKDLLVYSKEISPTWHVFNETIFENLQKITCRNTCNVLDFVKFLNYICGVLTQIKIAWKRENPLSKASLIFLDETKLFFHLLTLFLGHFTNNCVKTLPAQDYFQLFIHTLYLCKGNNLDIIFHIISYPFLLPNVYMNDSQLPDNFIGTQDNAKFKNLIKSFYGTLKTQNVEKNDSLVALRRFFEAASSGLLTNFNEAHLEQIESVFVKICTEILNGNDEGAICLMADSISHILTLFNNADAVISRIFLPLLTSTKEAILAKASSILPQIICTSSSDFIKVVGFSQHFTTNTFCDKCDLQLSTLEEKTSKIQLFLQKRFPLENVVAINFSKNRADISSSTSAMLKQILTFLTNGSVGLKLKSLETLPVFSSHILKFHSVNVVKIWVEKAGDADEEIRKEFASIVSKTVEGCCGNRILSAEVKEEIFAVFFATLLRIVKKSLQFSDYNLQYSLLLALEEISLIRSDRVLLHTLKILLYLIMIPTSKHSMIAVSKCYKMEKTHETNMLLIYKKNREQLCEVIVHLCTVNQALINYNLETSLVKVSKVLGFCQIKDFVKQEYGWLLPFFVAKIVKMPPVTKLIDEMARMLDLDVVELLVKKYGNIFLHIFLKDFTKEEQNQLCTYLEKTTGLSGPILRKRNFGVIFNELLLNFHEKQNKVILALTLLAKEERGEFPINLPDYLQKRFLAIILYFDMKLFPKTSKTDKILLSLADIIRFMGPKHIIPLRFKIIAMLQTANSNAFPKLNCQVWDAFIHSCDVEFLAPQLVTIFVSVLPLLGHCPQEINEIFKYLVIESEAQTKDFIPDLFFVDDQNVDHRVLLTIKKYVKRAENCNLKAKIRCFLKYLTHETAEVRIHGLRHLKGFMAESREELDQMILGYNGIDPTIVELIDILMLGCREKNGALKLACAEVIGELGAVEPSHLPRTYAQDIKSFTFFLHEDSFIVNVLGELVKSFQTDKNTQNMDRLALAIQEILKTYEISPDVNSRKNNLWLKFPESQKEIMLPLLSSRYVMAPIKSDFTFPIYGTKLGASFQDWLRNYTCCLISSLPKEQKRLLQVCFPSMRNDHRLLMQFLPHILLHSLTEGSYESRENSFTEFENVTNFFTNHSQLDDKILNERPLPSAEVPQVVETEEVKQMKCTKVVFLLLDFLDRWVREWMWVKGLTGRNDENLLCIKQFQSRFCKLQLAKCNYHCGEYPRALMYLEEYVTENPAEISAHLTFLAEIYAELDESDGVAGVTALQLTEPSVEQRILALEVSGKLAEAAACYERMPQPLKLHHVKGLIQCYLDLDNVNTALNFAQGALDEEMDFGFKWECMAEPFWRLGRWDDLEGLLQKPKMSQNQTWGVQIGKALLHVKNGERDEFKTVLDALKMQQVESLGAASLEEGAYQHGYCYISRLHSLNELQQIEMTINELLVKPNDNDFAKLVMKKLQNEWKLRIKVVQESVRIIEPMLCLRRVGLDLGRKIAKEKVPAAWGLFGSLLAESWLFSAETARAAGIHQQAYTYTLKAEEFAPPKLFLEKAKLHWLREEHEQALSILRRGVELITPEVASNSLDLEQKKIMSEAKLLIATYNSAISYVDRDANIQFYKEAINAYKEWEKSLVCLAQYYDSSVFQNYNDNDRDGKGSDIQLHMINFFGKSLQYGTTYVYQSMPRLLSIWFDYGTRLLDVTSSAAKEERLACIVKMTKLVDSFLDRLPAYIFLTAFSQLVSRICHPQKEVYKELKAIIVKLLQQYPQQTLWMIISVIKSSYPIRSKRCVEILADPKLKTNTMGKLVRDFTSLAEKLIELCNKELPPDINTFSVNTLVRALPRLLTKDDFSEIMMPTQKFRKLVLPNPDFQTSQHNPFPNRYVHIVGIEDEMNILASLQRPRKITLRGSDGKSYIFMLKPKDDLRKDFRLMEFNDIVNQLLMREPEARHRRLNIRLYSVAPLNEECGLIEWVPNLVGLRPVLLMLYKQRGIHMKGKELKEAACNSRDPLAKKRNVFINTLLKKHPPVLGEWFRKNFPDAQTWLTARTAFIRTTAVMSMAGYILGLGDRHGENILLDSNSGDAVHVDFNCLFNKGEDFEYPERVPFRLTQNMVSAMGPLGVEGLFRKACAGTLRVLRTNTNTLMSIVTPFVYDPLVSWPRNVPGTSHGNAERTNEKAMDHIRHIERRLQGEMATKNRLYSIPLSVEGQTNNLINEATSVDNLCQMYIGWGPYL